MNTPQSNRPLALVTGAGKKRVGYHVAEALAASGRNVAVHYLSSKEEAIETVEYLKTFGTDAEAFQADLTDEKQIERLFENVVVRFGRIDVLVNCAAIWRRKRLEETTADDVRNHFEANVLGTFLCGKIAGLIMTKQSHGGVIINIGDWAERVRTWITRLISRPKERFRRSRAVLRSNWRSETRTSASIASCPVRSCCRRA